MGLSRALSQAVAISFLVLVVATTSPLREEAGRDSEAALAYDDECLDGQCALSALQLKMGSVSKEVTAMASEAAACTGVDGLPDVLPLCYSFTMGQFHFETIITQYKQFLGKVDVVMNGVQNHRENDLNFTVDGAAVEVAGINSYSSMVTIAGIELCSDQHQLQVTLSRPFPLVLPFAQGDCSGMSPRGVASSQAYNGATWHPMLHLAQEFEAAGMLSSQGQVPLPCHGSEDFTGSLPQCFSAVVFVAHIHVKVHSFQNGIGQASLGVLGGPKAVNIDNKPFTKKNQDMHVQGINAYSNDVQVGRIQFCSAQNEILVTLSKPIPLQIPLHPSSC